MPIAVPSYLKGYEALYARDPHQAALSWFTDARFGLFMHYGLYSLLGRHEWVMYRENIPLAEYEQLAGQFTAERFDADRITDLALEAGMRYVNMTSRHHDSFCLFDSAVSDYNSVHSAAGRDLIGELAEQCQAKGLGLFAYYSYALDWRHPYFYPRRIFDIARPDYDPPEPRYKWEKDEDFRHYIDFVHAQLRELLTQYGPLAGIWLDPIMGYYARPDLFPIEETYALIRGLQPQALIAFKQGANGDEDFASPEREGRSLADRVRERIGEAQAEIAQRAWERNAPKHNEICDTMQPGAWGYTAADDGHHHTSDEVLAMLDAANCQNCNLLLNTGPLPNGSIHAEDAATLREVGRRLG
jgi:alpha-L-fucosidase